MAIFCALVSRLATGLATGLAGGWQAVPPAFATQSRHMRATMMINSTPVRSMPDETVNGVAIDAHIVQGPWVLDLPSHP
ncbi:MAG TPA: hypothetical protein VE338_02500 [Ktedonobacterales bacterium]|nr:hypothetical protein [Ktedonobacterales bacterium]